MGNTRQVQVKDDDFGPFPLEIRERIKPVLHMCEL
jgi:hypothetical protein